MAKTKAENIREALRDIQQALVCPKSHKNTFGNYNYRTCEDILEALKPLLVDATLTITDEIVLIGERYYVQATATLTLGAESVSTSAYAREPLMQKKMSDSQLTGSASSYARKYALNGLFCIDDCRDPDTQDNEGKPDEKPKDPAPDFPKMFKKLPIMSETQAKRMGELFEILGENKPQSYKFELCVKAFHILGQRWPDGDDDQNNIILKIRGN